MGTRSTILNAVADKIHAEFPTLPIYIDKWGQFPVPHIFMRLASQKMTRVLRELYRWSYFIQVSYRLPESADVYGRFEEMAYVLYDILETIELPIANFHIEGEQDPTEKKIVRGNGLQHSVKRDDDYPELHFFVRYAFYMFRPHPVTIKQNELKVQTKMKGE